jgi:cytochrome c-type biogenesis protein CcmE
MDPARKRTIRLVVALVCALGLATALVYTSFSAGSEAKTPSQLVKESKPGRSYQLTGKVVAGTIHRKGNQMDFTIKYRAGSATVPVSYSGAVPDPFRAGREVIVVVKKAPAGAGFIGEPDSLQTKCPSKFKEAKPGT